METPTKFVISFEQLRRAAFLCDLDDRMKLQIAGALRESYTDERRGDLRFVIHKFPQATNPLAPSQFVERVNLTNQLV